jgi:hypothetical protein
MPMRYAMFSFELGLKKEVTERLKGLGLPAAEHCIVVSIDQQKLWFFEGEDGERYVVSTARAGRGCVQDFPDDSRWPASCLREDRRRSRARHGLQGPPADRQAVGRIADAGRQPHHLAHPLARRLGAGPATEGQDAQEGSWTRVVASSTSTARTGRQARPAEQAMAACLLSDPDVIRLYGRVPNGTPVLIRD